MLADQVTSLLTPFLPFLVRFGERAADEAGSQAGLAGWEQAKGLWVRLRPRLKDHSAMEHAVRALASEPNDKSAREELRTELEHLLRKDEAFARTTAALISSETHTYTATTTSTYTGVQNLGIINEFSGTGQIIDSKDS
jgi:hypothetical protein